MPESVDILGVPVHNVTVDGALALIAQYVHQGTPHQVVTVNPEFVMAAQENSAFLQALRQADLSLPDGIGLLWAARMLGHPLSERVTGSDSLPLIAALAAKQGLSLYLLGAAPGVAQRAADCLVRANPGLKIVGTYSGSPSIDEEDKIVARITAVDPDMLFVAYGAPNQDLWIRRNLARLNVPVCMGVGGSLDFIAGIVPRAPLWMRKTGIEWLYRLLRQPSRWRRMLALPRFAWRVLREHFQYAQRS